MKLLFLFSFLSIIYLKVASLTKNWDDEFIEKLTTIGDEKIEIEKEYMLSYCINNPKQYSEIDNMCEAIQHYKNKSGKKVKANSNLIEHMKEYDNTIFNLIDYKSYKNVKKELIDIIADKIKNAKKNKEKNPIIQSAPNSERGAWYLTLGSYALNIEYNKSIDLSKNSFTFRVHFYGEDVWDFEKTNCSKWYDIACFLHNFFEEQIPEDIVGEGKKFIISYDFYDNLTININNNFFNIIDDDVEDSEDSEDSEGSQESNFQNNNKINLSFILLFLLF